MSVPMSTLRGHGSGDHGGRDDGGPAQRRLASGDFRGAAPVAGAAPAADFQEVAEYNARGGEVFRRLVQPAGTERALNGFRLTRPRRIDAEQQYERAIDASSRNGFMVIVDDHRVTDLNARVDLRRGTEVTFLKLVPLVGG